MTNEENNPNDNPPPHESVGKFGLNEPTGQFKDLKDRLDRESELAGDGTGVHDNIHSPGESDSVKYKNMGWKGIDDDDDDGGDDDDDGFMNKPKEPIPEDELDMTPMVDVTFLLLIFFMVTASFTLQKSLEQNHAKSEDPSPKPVDPDPDPPEDYVEILIDQSSTFYVTSRSEDEVECPSDSEMRSRVRDAVKSDGARRLVIIAHVDSLHRKVITAWDTALINDIQEIDFQTTEEDY